MDERLEYWLEQIVSKLGQLVYVGEKFCQRHAGHDFVLPPESDLRVMTFGKAIQKATDHFADANKMVSEEPAKKWRYLVPGEVIKLGDWVCSKSLPSCNDPIKGLGWMMARAVGLPVLETDGCVYARPVAEEPAKEPVEPPQPEYREPVLPADFCKPCEFSITGKDWYESLLAGFQAHRNPWISSDQGRWNYARIKKDA